MNTSSIFIDITHWKNQKKTDKVGKQIKAKRTSDLLSTTKFKSAD